MIRKAKAHDINGVVKIYDIIHEEEEKGKIFVGWIKDVYPTREDALSALRRDDLFVYEENGEILSSGIINKVQHEIYKDAPWEYEASDDEVFVFHTLAVLPEYRGNGIGTEFIKFYEDHAIKNGCYELRIDTNEKNIKARTMYKNLGYKEIIIVPTVFNRIPNTNLVLLEKNLKR